MEGLEQRSTSCTTAWCGITWTHGKRSMATFHDEVEELVDIEEVSEEDKLKPTWLLGFEEAEGRKHRMVRTVEGKWKVQCIRV